jgi:hypothetical protein
MEPFNIRIKTGSKDTTLTILPLDNETDYKVIYNGAIIGAVSKSAESWSVLPDDQVEAGDLPLYKTKYGEASSDVILEGDTLVQIGSEIDHQSHLI